MVSWDDAQVFLTRLNEQQAGNLPAGWSYVLPTEVQWEYACRAERPRHTHGVHNYSSNANYSSSDMQPVMWGCTANPWGFDMHGNVGSGRGLVPSGLPHRQPGG